MEVRHGKPHSHVVWMSKLEKGSEAVPFASCNQR